MGKTKTELVLGGGVAGELREFLREQASDGREAFAALLCGTHRMRGRQRLLARTVVFPEDDCFAARTPGGIALKPQFDDVLLGLAETQGLVPVQVHTHPGHRPPRFSMTDDRAEQSRSLALERELGLAMGSVVFDAGAEHCDARFWRGGKATSMRVMVELEALNAPTTNGRHGADETFDRQVRAFGAEFQRRLAGLTVGVVGAGGLGSVLIDQLTRMGVRKLVVVDPDRVERSNLNRLVGSTAMDARHGTPKTEISRRAVAGVHEQRARVTMWDRPVDDQNVIRSLAGCDLIVVATDNHVSRLVVQELATAYLRPIVHAGVGLEGKEGHIRRILGRAVSPSVGGPWCLYCRGIIDPNRASRESADPEHKAIHVARGYLPGTPDPAVAWANGALASLAVSMVHDRVFPFRTDNPARDVLFDLLDLEILAVDDPEATSDCVLCGAGGLRGLGDAWLQQRTRRAATALPNLV